MKKILAVFAHPDDETFGPGATLAKYAALGATIHVVTATRGEAGENHLKVKIDVPLGVIRERELHAADKILGVSQNDFLGFIDGTLRQELYFDIAKKLITKIETFRPDVILTSELHGVSGHLDHVAMSFITTYAYLKTNIAKKLYYFCLPEKNTLLRDQKYFIYFPEGYPESKITTRIDVDKYWPTKIQAMLEYKSQMKDVERLKKSLIKAPKIDNFILKYHRLKKVHLPETDLFAGI